MSYQIQYTHIHFADNLKGKIYLDKLTRCEDKINEYLKKKPCDILKFYQPDEALKQLQAHRFELFSKTKEQALIDLKAYLSHAYNMKIVKWATSLFIKTFLVHFCCSERAYHLNLALDITLIVALILAKVHHAHLTQEFVVSFMDLQFRYSVQIPPIPDDDCSICMEPLKDDRVLAGHFAMGKAHHIFHKKCLVPLLKSLGSSHLIYGCPLCRDVIVYQPLVVGQSDPLMGEIKF